jgi:hypothetical protein
MDATAFVHSAKLLHTHMRHVHLADQALMDATAHGCCTAICIMCSSLLCKQVQALMMRLPALHPHRHCHAPRQHDVQLPEAASVIRP